MTGNRGERLRFVIKRLKPGDAALYGDMLGLFGRAFDDPVTYGAARPGAEYRDRLLARARKCCIPTLARNDWRQPR